MKQIFFLITNLFVDEIGQGGIAHEQPTPGCDSVGLVLELLWPQLEEGPEQVGLDQLRVDAGNTVDSVRSNNGLKYSNYCTRF